MKSRPAKYLGYVFIAGFIVGATFLVFGYFDIVNERQANSVFYFCVFIGLNAVFIGILFEGKFHFDGTSVVLSKENTRIKFWLFSITGLFLINAIGAYKFIH